MGLGMGRLRIKWSYDIEAQLVKRLPAHIHACQVVQKNVEAEEDVHLCVEAEEAAIEGQDVAAEGEVMPDAGLEEVQAGVGIYGGAAFLEDGHYAAEDVGSGTMFAADGAITLHNSLVAIQLDNAVKNVSACDTEKYDVSYGQRAGIGQGFQFHGIPVPTYEGEHAHALDGDGYILAFAEDPEDFREKYVIADNYFLHNCLPVYLPD